MLPTALPASKWPDRIQMCATDERGPGAEAFGGYFRLPGGRVLFWTSGVPQRRSSRASRVPQKSPVISPRTRVGCMRLRISPNLNKAPPMNNSSQWPVPRKSAALRRFSVPPLPQNGRRLLGARVHRRLDDARRPGPGHGLGAVGDPGPSLVGGGGGAAMLVAVNRRPKYFRPDS